MRTKFRLPFTSYELKLAHRDQTVLGQEIPDPVPVAPPLGYVKQPSMVEHIRQMIRSEKLRLEAEQAGMESFEEADDFEVEDDPEAFSPYEWEPSFEPSPAYTITPQATPVAEPPAPAGSSTSAGPLDPPRDPPEGGERRGAGEAAASPRGRTK